VSQCGEDRDGVVATAWGALAGAGRASGAAAGVPRPRWRPAGAVAATGAPSPRAPRPARPRTAIQPCGRGCERLSRVLGPPGRAPVPRQIGLSAGAPPAPQGAPRPALGPPAAAGGAPEAVAAAGAPLGARARRRAPRRLASSCRLGRPPTPPPRPAFPPPGHPVALDRERLELYCALCGDYVYCEDFDRAVQVGMGRGGDAGVWGARSAAAWRRAWWRDGKRPRHAEPAPRPRRRRVPAWRAMPRTDLSPSLPRARGPPDLRRGRVPGGPAHRATRRPGGQARARGARRRRHRALGRARGRARRVDRDDREPRPPRAPAGARRGGRGRRAARRGRPAARAARAQQPWEHLLHEFGAAGARRARPGRGARGLWRAGPSGQIAPSLPNALRPVPGPSHP
jgi:hypothetical protein